MKKILIIFVPFLFSCLMLQAQYTGGNGSGAFTGSLSGKHLTNWFQTNGSWSTPGNWIDGVVPTSAEEANISAEATLDGDYTYPVVNIGAGGVLTIPEGNTLTVTDDLQNGNGNSGLMLQNGSSLIHHNANVPGTMQRQVSNADWANGMDGWHLLSSPVENQLLVNGGFTADPYDFYAWGENTNAWLNQKVGANNITSFIPGTGYLVSYDDGGTKTFAGELNVADISLSNLSKTGSSYYIGYHLLGNPYPSALKWNDGNWALANVGGVASVWNETAQNYTSLANPNDIIPANQGFFVQVTDAINSITLPSAARTHSLTAFYKEIPADYLKLRITNSVNATFDETIVRLKHDATGFFDPAYDGHKITGSDIAPHLYTMIQPGEKAAVNTVGSSDVPSGIEMGFRPGLNATYTLKAEEFTFDRQIVLEDRVTGATIILEAGTSYAFNGTSGDDENRFMLHFSPVGIPAQEEGIDFQAYASGDVIYIKSPEKTGADVRITSVSGQKVYHGKLTSETLSSVSTRLWVPGIYLVQITTENRSLVKKVIIQ
ncbi:MAG: T9SS type A sorting domain-containing protein [Bacteroidales bacterium]|nr:T9SS type A sorting domain-containing protein [Bacteroidales bacterium]